MKRSSSKKEYVSVYRIEKRGRGPFQYYSTEYDSGLEGSINWDLPTPEFDKGIDRNVLRKVWIKDYRFGAPTGNALKEWVKKPDVLHRLGFKVSLYKADKASTISSDIQSMFLKRKAKKVKEWEIVEFMKGEKKTYA